MKRAVESRDTATESAKRVTLLYIKEKKSQRKIETSGEEICKTKEERGGRARERLYRSGASLISRRSSMNKHACATKSNMASRT